MPDKLPRRVVRVHWQLDVRNPALNGRKEVELRLSAFARDAECLALQSLFIQYRSTPAAPARQNKEALHPAGFASELAQV